MLALVSEVIERYCRSHTKPESTLFRRLAKETYASCDVPQMQVGHLEGAFLRLLVRLAHARRVLEIGTFTGYSALAMAEGLPKNGKLWTLDVNLQAARIARRAWSGSPHGKKIELRLGPAWESLKHLPGPFDLVFIDADKENYLRYWEACVPKICRGGLLAADNVLWSGRVLNPKSEEDRAIADFNERVKRDRRVEAVMLPVRDGITLAWKR